MQTTYSIQSKKEFCHFGMQFAKTLTSACIIHFIGDLGSGKTTLIRAILSGLGYHGIVSSPTYTLMAKYEVGGQTIAHYDLYRLKHEEELAPLGLETYDPSYTYLIEWADLFSQALPLPDIQLQLLPHNRKRKLVLTGCSSLGNQMIVLLQT